MFIFKKLIQKVRWAKGFTLIEMLIVVGIIGVLSSILLNVFNPAREKTKDARIVQEINGIRSLAETLYGGKYSSLPEFPDENVNNENLLALINDINNLGGDVRIIKSPDERTYIVYSRLNSKVVGENGVEIVQFYCLDSGGKAVFLTNEPDRFRIKNSETASCEYRD